MARTTLRTTVPGTPWRVVGAALVGALTLAAVGLVTLLAIVPAALGGTALTVLTGSMEPTFRPGDIVVVRSIDPADVCRQVSVGDVVTYLPEPDDPSLITHRVVAKRIGTFDDGTACRLLTQGDASTAVDAPVSPAQVRGVFWYGLPKLGWVKQWVLDRPTTALAVAAGALIAWWLLPRRRSTQVVHPARSGADRRPGPARTRAGAARAPGRRPRGRAGNRPRDDHRHARRCVMPGQEPATADSRIVYVTLVGDGLSRRRRAVSWLLAVALLALAGIGSTYAGFAPVLTGQPASQPLVTSTAAFDALPHECHPTTQIAWNGRSYDTIELTVVGHRVTTPGDHVTCRFVVPNGGPSDATMSVSLQAVQLAVGPANPDLARDVELVWDVAGTRGTVPFDQAIARGEHVVAEVEVSQGAVAPVLVGFTMPVGTTADARHGQDSTVLSFDVMVTLRGDDAPTPGPVPQPSRSPASAVLASTTWQTARLGSTGAEVAVAAGIALVLLLVGTVVWVVARRRRDQAQSSGRQSGRPPGPRSAGSSPAERQATAPYRR